MSRLSDCVDAHLGHKPASGGGMFVVMNEVDLDVAEAEKGSALAAADIIELLKIPERYMVHNVFVEIKTAAAGTTLTAHIGVADTNVTGYDVDGFDATMNLKAAAGTKTYGIDGTDAYVTAGGFLMPADEGGADKMITIDATLVTVTAITSNPVLRVYALCSQMPAF